jgi:hypothetical protein
LEDGEWAFLEEGSSCTTMPIDSPRELLVRGAAPILDATETAS